MTFRDTPAIFLQIADYVCEQILLDKWKVGDRLVSIRELAVMMEVNPNTVQRAYDFLQQRSIISNRRGVGYFIEGDALAKILQFRREQFFAHELPVLLKNIYLLGVTMEEIQERYQDFTSQAEKLQRT
jgi:GntR family transcriptional regulator